MRRLARAIGVAYVLLGLSVAVSPERMISAADWESRQGLFVAAAIRVAVGLVLLLAAPTSRYPTMFRVMGTIALIVGLVMPLTPIEIFAEYMRWWMVENVGFFRAVFATAATLFGAFMVYAARPNAGPPNKEMQQT